MLVNTTSLIISSHCSGLLGYTRGRSACRACHTSLVCHRNFEKIYDTSFILWFRPSLVDNKTLYLWHKRLNLSKLMAGNKPKVTLACNPSWFSIEKQNYKMKVNESRLQASVLLARRRISDTRSFNMQPWFARPLHNSILNKRNPAIISYGTDEFTDRH